MNQFELALGRAEHDRKTFYARQAVRVAQFYETHPQNKQAVLAVTNGRTIRDAKSEIDVSHRFGRGWWDKCGAGSAFVDEENSKWKYWADGRDPEELKREKNAPGRRGEKYEVA